MAVERCGQRLDRATVAYAGLGANLPQDAVYPANLVDNKGQPLDGDHRYTIHFDKGQEPPVNAFWSITMYDQQGYLVANPIPGKLPPEMGGTYGFDVSVNDWDTRDGAVPERENQVFWTNPGDGFWFDTAGLNVLQLGGAPMSGSQ